MFKSIKGVRKMSPSFEPKLKYMEASPARSWCKASVPAIMSWTFTLLYGISHSRAASDACPRPMHGSVTNKGTGRSIALCSRPTAAKRYLNPAGEDIAAWCEPKERLAQGQLLWLLLLLSLLTLLLCL